MNTKNNQRYIETENRIIKVTQELISEKGVRETTVSEICRRAGINRKSFYLHFPDVDAVLNKLETLKGKELASKLSFESKDDIKGLLVQIFDLFAAEKDFYKPFVTQRCSGTLLEPVIEKFWTSREESMLPKCRGMSDLDRTYHENFYKSGVCSVLSLWMERDFEDSPEDLASVIEREYKSSFC